MVSELSHFSKRQSTLIDSFMFEKPQKQVSWHEPLVTMEVDPLHQLPLGNKFFEYLPMLRSRKSIDTLDSVDFDLEVVETPQLLWSPMMRTTEEPEEMEDTKSKKWFHFKWPKITPPKVQSPTPFDVTPTIHKQISMDFPIPQEIPLNPLQQSLQSTYNRHMSLTPPPRTSQKKYRLSTV